MSDISRAAESLKEDFNSADALVTEIYDKYFAKYFKREIEMHLRFQDPDVPITDKELEWLITSLPLELFSVSNALAQFKQHNEIVKLKVKQRSKNKDSDPDGLDEEYKLMSIIYSSVILRVEQEISFSKELIMGAKKVWDARRTGEHAPISEIVIPPELPEYTIDDKKRPEF
jgi:hypothetical protein